jgi:hypothetical protein
MSEQHKRRKLSRGKTVNVSFPSLQCELNTNRSMQPFLDIEAVEHDEQEEEEEEEEEEECMSLSLRYTYRYLRLTILAFIDDEAHVPSDISERSHSCIAALGAGSSNGLVARSGYQATVDSLEQRYSSMCKWAYLARVY